MDRSVRRVVFDTVASTFPGVVFFAAVAAGVHIAEKKGVHTQIPSDFLQSAFGLVIGFAQGRLQEAVRNFASFVWIHVGSDVHAEADAFDANDHSPEAAAARQASFALALEKQGLIRLAVAFPVVLKHTLRCEPGAYWDDLYPLVQHLPRYADAGVKLMPIWRESEEVRRVARGHSTDVERGPLLRAPPSSGSHETASTSATTVRVELSATSEKPGKATHDPLSILRFAHRSTTWRPRASSAKRARSTTSPASASSCRPCVRLCPRPPRGSGATAGSRKCSPCDPRPAAPVLGQHLEALGAAGHLRAGYDGDALSHAKTLRAAAVDLRVLRDGGLAFAYEAHLRVCTLSSGYEA